MKYGVVINERSGMVQREKDHIQSVIIKAGLTDTVFFCDHNNFEKTVLSVLDSGIDVLIVGGGDGSLHTAANYLINTDIALGLLPLGTFNNFARDNGIPTEIEEALAVIKQNHVSYVDVAVVNDIPFLNNVSIGIYPHSVLEREMIKEQFQLGKFIAMGIALLKHLWLLKHYHVSLLLEGKEQHLRSPFLFVGNNIYRKEYVSFVRHAPLQSGKLCLLYVERTTRWGMIKTFLKVMVGRLRSVPELQVIETNSVVIRHKPAKIKIALDGETSIVNSPLSFHIRPQSLQLIVPKDLAQD